MINGSSRMFPTVMRGFRDSAGSWKIICISRLMSPGRRPAISAPLKRMETLHRLVQAHDGLAQGGLTTTAFPDEAQRLALFQGEGNAIHRAAGGHRAVQHPSFDREMHAKTGDLQQGHRAEVTRLWGRRGTASTWRVSPRDGTPKAGKRAYFDHFQ